MISDSEWTKKIVYITALIGCTFFTILLVYLIFFGNEKIPFPSIFIVVSIDVGSILGFFYNEKRLGGNKMSSYGIELTEEEMIYLFFKKKSCPECGCKLKRLKKISKTGKKVDGVELGKVYVGEQNQMKIFYRGSTCNKVYAISELSHPTNN